MYQSLCVNLFENKIHGVKPTTALTFLPLTGITYLGKDVAGCVRCIIYLSGSAETLPHIITPFTKSAYMANKIM